MIELGNYNTLKILRGTSVGLFLGDDDVDDLLLPNKYAPTDFEIGDEIRVFCYLDHEERPIATTLDPFIKRDEFGFIRVAEVNEYGAFMDWGLEKHLLVPFREQRIRMNPGEWYVVYCYLDEKSFRLVASARVNRFLSKDHPKYRVNDEVQLLVSRKSDLGWDVIVDNQFKGLVFSNEVFQQIKVGDRLAGFVKNVRPDGKLDITLQPIGLVKLDPAATQIYDRLLEEGGVLNIHDKSSPQDIMAMFQMSKKTFKRAIGSLYKQRRIEIKEDGIYKI
ncbi:S1 RNA-binding domain-containing protein [Muriicola sp. Z0-33]|uniref:CvfB family protein n=1 Tax=Muriicola sp. Z0-33 TaxID=2816957 RepID=UPI002238B8D9|nr:S1-like domain-containing RNA-binding protein [Muriicola sp. Z0-33]MCW5516601.1 GntR family transcriptional regulator [Muriicola sp. Z0-33]